MSFKGLTSTLLLITLIGITMGFLVDDRLSATPSDPPAATQVPGQASLLEAFFPQGEDDSQPATPTVESVGDGDEYNELAEEKAALESERQRLEEWEQGLQAQQAMLDSRIKAIEALLASIQEKETSLKGEIAALEAERAELTAQWSELGEIRSALEDARADLDRQRDKMERDWDLLQQRQAEVDEALEMLAEREQQAQTLAAAGQAMLVVAMSVMFVHLVVAVILRLRHHRPDQLKVAREDVKLRRAILRPMKRSHRQASHTSPQQREQHSVEGHRQERRIRQPVDVAVNQNVPQDNLVPFVTQYVGKGRDLQGNSPL